MRIIQGIVKYKLQMKQTPTHVQHKTNTYKIWDIDHGNYNIHYATNSFGKFSK